MIIIDRLENDLAVVEYKNRFYNIPKDWLPIKAKEGDVLKLYIEVDGDETSRLRKEVKRKLEDLFE